jgi:uncharacterized CHY-type Zn-finger protein
MGQWFVTRVCRQCDKLVSVNAYLHNGCCPYCGYHERLLNFWKEKVVRRMAPWWKFWG